MSLQYFGGNDLVHALSEEEGAEIEYPRRSRKAGKARGSAEQRPAVTRELAKSSLRARLCSRSVSRPIAIGLQAGPGRANSGRQPRATGSLPEGQSVNGDGISGALIRAPRDCGKETVSVTPGNSGSHR